MNSESTVPGTGTRPALIRALLRMPLYYKLIIANAAITLAAVLTCAAYVANTVRTTHASTNATTWTIIAIAVAIGIIVNSAVIHVALSPVRNLVAAAGQISAGNDNARAIDSSVSDAALDDVATVFNATMDTLTTYRVRLREIAIRAIDAGEAERGRLSRELHDGVAQTLAATLLNLRTVRTAADESMQEPLARLATQISASINELHGLAISLRPPALDMIGLTAALQSHARMTSEMTGVSVDAKISDVNNSLPSEAELALYRLVQEALLNVVTHAGADTAIVRVAREGAFVRATISDEGRGFDLNDALASGALGLFGMYERALYVGGHVDIDSRLGAGTVVRITLPMESAHG